MPVRSLDTTFAPEMAYTPWAIQEKLRRFLDGQPRQQGMASKRLSVLLHLNAALEERYTRSRVDELRHQITEWLIGEPSTKYLSEAQATALLNWMTYRNPTSGEFEARPALVAELMAILEQSMRTAAPSAIDKRQLTLL